MRKLLPLLVLMPTLAFAQGTFQEKVTVTYVEVPVTVLGRDNAPIRGLTRANFELRDGGEKRDIQSFDAIDFAATGTQKVISPLNPASRRNFLLLFDLSYSSPISIGRAQEAARNFIARGIGRRDLVGIAVVDVNHGIRFLTSFTTDRNLLNAAIRDPRHFMGFDPLQLTLAHGTVNEEGAGGAGAGTASDAKDAVAKELTADFARAVANMDDAYRRSRVKRQVEMLRFIARSLQKVVGRKHIVLLSEGFDPRLVQGRIAGDVKEQVDENSAVSSGELWKIDSDKRFGSADAQKSISDMAEEFRRADVVLHAVDIKGLRVQSDVRDGARSSSNEGLFLLTNSTGGTVFRNSNDIGSDFDRLSRQHEVVYVIGFQAPVGRAGEFRDLRVKLVNVPGARVQHRGGYYSSGNESTVERTLSSAEVIMNDISQNDIDLAAIATPFPTASRKSQVPVILEIAGDDLLKKAGKSITAEIFVYAFDEDGFVRDSLSQRMHLDLAQVGERLRGGGIKFYGTLSLAPGRYAIKNLVRVAESDARGYQRLDIVVPSIDDVAVTQPLFFEEPRGWVMVKGGSSDTTNAPYPFVLDGQSFIPAARANLRKGEPRLFTVWVYNARPDEVTLEIAPEAKLVSSKPDADADVTKYVYALERVPADTRELGVTIRKKGSTDERRVTVPIFPR